MKTKIFAIVPLVTIIIASCISTNNIVPTEIPTLIPSLIPTITSTATPVPTFTATPLPYTSCLDSELMSNLDEEFEKEIGKSIEDHVQYLLEQKRIQDVFLKSNSDKGMNIIIFDMVYVGKQIVSLENLPGSKAGDKAFCAFFVQSGNPNQKLPIILNFIFEGRYYPATLGLYDGREGLGYEATFVSDYDSMEQAITWFSDRHGPQLGDVFYNEIYTFSDIDNFDDLENEENNYYIRRDNLLILLRALDNSLLERLEGNGFSDLHEKLMSGKGDIGAFAKNVYWCGSGKLSGGFWC